MNRAQRQFQVKFEVDGQGKIQAELESISRQGKSATERSRELARSVMELGDRVDDAAARTRQYARDQALLDAALKAGVITSTEQARLLQQAWEQTPDGERWADFGDKIGSAMKWAGAAAVAGMGLVIRETAAAAQELAQLREVVDSTGQAAGYSVDRLVAMADEFEQRLKVFSGGEIMSAQTRLLSYTNIVGEQFPRALQAASDMSVRYSMSIEQAAETVGKALQSPSKATQALARQGYEFSEAEVAKMEAMEAAGRVAEAQTYILEALEEGQRNAAAAAGGEFTGALKGLQHTLQGLITGQDGSLDGATDAVNDLSDALNSPDVRAGFEAMVSGITATTAAALAGIGALIRYRETLQLAGQGDAFGLTNIDPTRASDAALQQRQNDIANELNKLDLARRGNIGQRIDGSFWRAITTDLANPGGWTPAGREAQLRNEQSRLIDEQRRRAQAERQQQVNDWVANALAQSHSVTAGGAGDSSDLVDPDLQKQLDKVREQADAYGLSRAALERLNKEKALAAATNDVERAAIEQAYDALIQRVEADDRAKEGTKASTQAKREEARLAAQLERQVRDLTDRYREQIALQGDTREAARMLYATTEGALAGVSDEIKAQLMLLAEQEDRIQAVAQAEEAAAKIVEDMQTPLERKNAALASLNELLALGVLGYQDYARAVAEATDAYTADVKATASQGRSYLQQMMQDWSDLATGIDYAAAQSIDSLSDSITDLVVDGEADIERLGRSIVRTFTRVMVDKSITDFLAAFGGGAGGGASAGGGGMWAGVTRWLSGMFGGSRASGGGVGANRIYEVTEHGRPELLRQGDKTWLLPGRDGVVVPAAAGRAPATAAGPQVQVNVHNAPPGTEVRQGQTADGMPKIDVLIGALKRDIAGEISSGTGAVYSGIKRRFGLREPT